MSELQDTVAYMKSRLERLESGRVSAPNRQPKKGYPLSEKAIGAFKGKKKETGTKTKLPQVNFELLLGQILNRLGVVALIVGLAR